jgi:hypothetical protein
MQPVLRAALLALGSLLALCPARGQTAELPPIFAPRPASDARDTRVESAPRRSTSPVSGRVRSLIILATTRVLEDAVVFDAPNPTGETYVESTTGMTVMAPVVVRGESLKESQVRPPTLQLYHFVPFGGDSLRRVAGGATATLWQTFIGNKDVRLELSILNAAGNGIDHNIDFTRAELGFRIRF